MPARFPKLGVKIEILAHGPVHEVAQDIHECILAIGARLPLKGFDGGIGPGRTFFVEVVGVARAPLASHLGLE
jgi:hypothetical protein